MSINVRKANQKDVVSIVKMNKALALETESLILEDQVVSLGVANCLNDSGKGSYFLAEYERSIIGQVMFTFEWSDWRNGWIWWIQSVYVEPSFRGKGVFKSLFNHVEMLALAQLDVVAIRLYVEIHNLIAKEVYQKVGMHHAGYEVFQKKCRPQPDSKTDNL